MPRQLPADCLNEVFKHLEDKVTLHSCLSVNRLWCEISVQVLWRNIWNYNTLIACLPNESKEVLCKNEIIISTPTSKHLLFNYTTFIKSISIDDIDKKIKGILKNHQLVDSENIMDFNKNNDNNDNKCMIVTQEIIKMIMSQISLKELKLNYHYKPSYIPNETFVSYPGAIDCLKNLSELSFNSNLDPELFYQLSQMCHNIQSLSMDIGHGISNGLMELISVQQNLKWFKTFQTSPCEDFVILIPSLIELSNTLIKLSFYGRGYSIPLSFVAEFTNLQELAISFDDPSFEGFEKLQHVVFSQLRILKFQRGVPKLGYLVNFFANNGKNLEEIYIEYYKISLNSTIAKYCPNLKSLYTIFMENEIKTLQKIFNSCQRLESIEVWCGSWNEGGGCYLKESELLQMVINDSPKTFNELKIYYTFRTDSALFPKDLESFFTSWTNRVPQKSISFIINSLNKNGLANEKENMDVIQKYIKLGVVRKFKITNNYNKICDFD